MSQTGPPSLGDNSAIDGLQFFDSCGSASTEIFGFAFPFLLRQLGVVEVFVDVSEESVDNRERGLAVPGVVIFHEMQVRLLELRTS